MEEFAKKDYTEVIEALESGMLDTSDLASYMDIILHALYVCRNQCTEDDDLKITPEEVKKKIAKEIIEYINKRFNSPDHGESYWVMPYGQHISADVGYAQEWWDDCMSIELVEKYGL